MTKLMRIFGILKSFLEFDIPLVSSSDEIAGQIFNINHFNVDCSGFRCDFDLNNFDGNRGVSWGSSVIILTIITGATSIPMKISTFPSKFKNSYQIELLTKSEQIKCNTKFKMKTDQFYWIRKNLMSVLISKMLGMTSP